MSVLVLLNNFLHDLSAAGWLFGAVLLWSILRKEIPEGPAGTAVVQILKTVVFLMRLSVVGIVIFGVVRAIAYKSYEWSAAAGAGQVTLLIAKHVVFTGLFVLGLVYYMKAHAFIKSRGDEEAK